MPMVPMMKNNVNWTREERSVRAPSKRGKRERGNSTEEGPLRDERSRADVAKARPVGQKWST